MEETSKKKKKRIKLIFANEILSKTQKNDGLNHSWLLLQPRHQTLSDVISYILDSFALSHLCPRGIRLSMEGYALPEFESTSILKDRDLISVKKKETRLIGANKATEEAKTYVEDKIVEKQPTALRFQLLANDEFNVETEVRSPVRNSRNGDLASKKRKAPSQLENSKKKRKQDVIVKTAQKKNPHNREHITKPQKRSKHAISCPGVAEKCTNDLKPESNSERLDQNKEDTAPTSGVSDGPKKVSRSTLRKRRQGAIKRLHRAKATMVGQCDNQQPVKDITNIIKQADEDSDADGDLVPVEIRPGLIRFTPSGKVKDVQKAKALDVPSNQNGESQKEAYRWTGITNKRKGQKEVREKPVPSSWQDTKVTSGHSSSTWGAKNQSSSSWHELCVNGQSSNGAKNQSSSSWHELCVNGQSSNAAKNQSSSSWHALSVNGQSSNTWAVTKYPPKKKPLDFNKLLPLLDLPKAGDIIAYRLLELLSSSLCPALSSFRVGKISSFEPESNKTILVPVPEYPLNLKKKETDNNDADKQPIGASYHEDGTLETDFMSLNDVRIVKLANTLLEVLEHSKTPNPSGSWTPSTSKKDDEAHGSWATSTSKKDDEPHDASNKASDTKDVWEEVAEAVLAKKAQVLQEDRWNQRITPVRHSWAPRNSRGRGARPFTARFRR